MEESKQKNDAIIHKDNSLNRLDVSFIKHIDLKEYRIGLECGLDKEEFGKFEEQVKVAFRDYEGEIKRFEVFHVGATIGVHTGPYPTGIALLKRCRY